MAISVGSVEVDVIPNTSGIYQRLRSQLVPAATRAGTDAGEAAGRAFAPALAGSVSDSVAAAIGQRVGQAIGRQIASQVSSSLRDGITTGGRTATPAATRAGDTAGGAFGRMFQTRVQAALRSLPDITVGADTSEAEAEIRALRVQLETLSTQRIGIDIDAETARTQIAGLQAELARLGANHPDIAVRADTAAAVAQLALLQADIDRMDGRDINVGTQGAVRSVGNLSSAIVGLGPIAVPILATLAGAVGGLATAFVSAGAGAGVLALAVKPQLTEIKKAQQLHLQYATAVDKSGKNSVAAKNALAAYNTQLHTLPPASQATAAALDNLKGVNQQWSDSLAKTTMPVFTKGINALAAVLPKLTPLVQVAAKAAGGLVDSFSRWVGGGGVDRVVKFLSGTAGPALSSFGRIAANVASGIGGVLKSFAPSSAGALGALTNLTARFQQWGQSGAGVRSLLAYVQTVGPKVWGFFRDTATVVGHLVQAFAPLGGVGLTAIGMFAKLTSALPVPIMKALVTVVAASVVGLKLYAFYTTIVAAATKAWSIAQAIFNAVMDASPITLVIIAIVALVAAIVLAYQHSETFRAIVQAAWAGIQAAASFAWNQVLKPVFGALKTAFGAVGTAASWLWTNAIKPIFGWIGDKGKWLWANVLKPYFTSIKSIFHAVGDAASWLWKNAIKPSLQSVGDKASWLWKNVLKPSFDLMKKGIKAVGDSFSDARDFIGKAWDKVQDIAKKPVKFLINTVYNGGIVPMWNKVATAFGAHSINKMVLPKGFAVGGKVSGPGTETSDSVLARLSRNEHVWTAREVKGAGGHGAVMAMRQAAATGQLALPGFKDGGGLFSWVGSAASALKGAGSAAWSTVKKGASWLKDTLEGTARGGVKAVVDPLLARLPGADTSFGKLIRQIPDKIVSSIFGYSKKADDKSASSLGGKIPAGKHRTIISQALAAAHVPPPGTLGQWLTGMNTLIGRESGWNASAINLTDSNAKAGIPSQGLAQTIPPTFAHYVPKALKSRGILDPVANVAASIRYIVSRYGNITKVQQANASLPPKGYDSGGYLQPGLNLAYNGTGRPEPVFTTAQANALASGRSAAAAPATFEGDLYLDSGEFLGKVRGEANQVVNARLSGLSQRMRANGGGR